MKLYHYNHCPYCLRVRMIIAWKKLDIRTEIIPNADEKRHYDLIDAKVVPILRKATGEHIKESLDIIHYLDQNFATPILKDQPDSHKDTKLSACLTKASSITRYLTHPRNIQIFTKDFPSQIDADYYEKKKSLSIGSFQTALKNTPLYIAMLKPVLDEMSGIVLNYKPLQLDHSYADILLFPLLRSISHVKDLSFPPAIHEYMNKISATSNIPLLYESAI